MKKLRIGIVGGAGYTGGELLRLLLRHPGAEIAFVHSSSQAGKPVHAVHGDLFGETELQFTGQLHRELDVLFLCLGHGGAAEFLRKEKVDPRVKLIDLSQDFRLAGPGRESFVYGLPELDKEAIRAAERIANPGCFATAIQLALLPLAGAGLLSGEVHISATTGSTGAGQALSPTSHFSWRSGNLSVYKAFQHQHLGEIHQSLRRLQPDFREQIRFIPLRGGFTRGILAHFNNEAEFAGVLGHEIGHITARHSAQQYSRQILAQVGLVAGMVLINAVQIAAMFHSLTEIEKCGYPLCLPTGDG